MDEYPCSASLKPGPVALSIERRLLAQPRRTAGIDGRREPVRLGERDSTGHVVGYIDDDGLAWHSLAERIVAVCGQRLADAIVLPDDDSRRDQRIDDILVDVPDELIAEVAREAANHIWIRALGPPF